MYIKDFSCDLLFSTNPGACLRDFFIYITCFFDFISKFVNVCFCFDFICL